MFEILKRIQIVTLVILTLAWKSEQPEITNAAKIRRIITGNKRFLLIICAYCGWVAAYIPFLTKKVKKSEIFSRLPLDFFPENSIIGFTLERDGGNADGRDESPRDFRED